MKIHNCDSLGWDVLGVSYASVGGACGNGSGCGFTAQYLGSTAANTGWSVGAFQSASI